MTDLFELAEKKSNAAEFTVSELSGALKRTVEEAYGNVRVRGEVSGYRGPHASGHAYFALKDDRARLEAVIWRGTISKLRFKPEEGMEVIATGKLTTYPGSSKYQIVIEGIEPAGAGALMALLEERKRKLAAEGLFDEARKQVLPFMPRVIGVVTSPTGAVIRDIIHRISDRFPLHILVWPVRVQGETSAAEVAAAVAGFNLLAEGGPVARPDLVIVARGGGSLEDLWGFNDEIVVRAVAASQLPVVAAVGHETDWTLIDYAADIRAPTPTGAAEMAVPVKAELEAGLASLNVRLKSALFRLLEFRRQRLSGLQRALPTADHLLALPRRRYDEAANRLARALVTSVSRKKSQFEGFARQLSPFLIHRPMQEKRRTLMQQAGRLPRALITHLDIRQQDCARLARRLHAGLIVRIAGSGRQALLPLVHRAATAFLHSVAGKRQYLDELGRLLKTLSYENVLERGFALVLDRQNMPVKKAQQVSGGDKLTLRFADGEAGVTADNGVGRPSSGPAARAGKTKAGKTGGNQGTLF